MKRINVVRLILDILMAVGFIFLMDLDLLHIGMHERVGLMIGLLFVGHLVINHKQIKVLVKKLFNAKIPARMRLNYWLDLVLLVVVVLLIVSGLGMSRTIFTNIQYGDVAIWVEAHEVLANIALAIVVAHVFLHWKWLLAMVKGIGKVFQTTSGKYAVIGTALALVLIFAGVGMADAKVHFPEKSLNNLAYYRSDNIAVGDDAPTTAMPTMTLTQLAQYDGQNGQPSYIAVDGLVYDVSQYFINGEHNGAYAGLDQSGHISGRKCANALYNHCAVVGILVDDTGQGNVSSNRNLSDGDQIGVSPQNQAVACTYCQAFDCDGQQCQQNVAGQRMNRHKNHYGNYGEGRHHREWYDNDR